MSPAHDKTPRPASLGQDLYDKILSDLLSLTIGPGDRLTVDALARRFAVSPTPIREALARLEADGLVSKTHLRGFRASPQLSREDVEAMFEVRLLLEPRVACLAAELRTAAQADRLRELGARMTEVAASPGAATGYRDFAVLDAEFHAAVAQAGANLYITDSLDRLHVHLHLFRLHRNTGVVHEAAREHTLIVDSILTHDGIVAEAAMRSHLVRSRDRIRAEFDA
jgi:DNA-binding GntR family transcriptional regulator